MDNLGFTATPVGGSMLLFMPENKEDEAISSKFCPPNSRAPPEDYDLTSRENSTSSAPECGLRKA